MTNKNLWGEEVNYKLLWDQLKECLPLITTNDGIIHPEDLLKMMDDIETDMKLDNGYDQFK